MDKIQDAHCGREESKSGFVVIGYVIVLIVFFILPAVNKIFNLW